MPWYFYYIFIILLLYYYYIFIILLLYFYYIIIIFLLYYYYIFIIFLLYYYYIFIIFLLYYYYIIIILLLYYYYTCVYFCICFIYILLFLFHSRSGIAESTHVAELEAKQNEVEIQTSLIEKLEIEVKHLKSQVCWLVCWLVCWPVCWLVCWLVCFCHSVSWSDWSIVNRFCSYILGALNLFITIVLPHL